jgi:tetratricopeptide (TPR) repeat protein
MPLALLLALLASGPVGASAQASDRTAVEAYHRGDYETARSLWLAALEGVSGEKNARPSSAERGRILYDLGNVAFRKGDALEAVGWYTASLRLRPRDADAWKNLEHARTTAKLEPADRGDLVSTLWRIVASLTLAESEWLALAGAAVWAVALAAEALRGGRLLRRLALLGAGLALASLAPWIYHCARAAHDPVLVIEASERGAEIRSEPRADAAVIASAASGEEIERQDELPGWVKVEVPGGASGWMESRAAFALTR